MNGTDPAVIHFDTQGFGVHQQRYVFFLFQGLAEDQTPAGAVSVFIAPGVFIFQFLDDPAFPGIPVDIIICAVDAGAVAFAVFDAGNAAHDRTVLDQNGFNAFAGSRQSGNRSRNTAACNQQIGLNGFIEIGMVEMIFIHD